MKTAAVVFDFDGVLVADSDAVLKKDAWAVVLDSYVGRYECLLKEVLFIGDSSFDADVANELGCRFLGMSNRWNMWEAVPHPFPVISDFSNITQYL